MSDPDLYVSNGTCYSAPGKKLDASFIPCGNAAFGHKTCCGAGDNCLADNACFGFHGSGYGSWLTYMAGCTDPEYKDPSCPNKDVDQAWVALTLCDHTDGVWAICSQKGDPTTLQPGSYCSCTVASSATVAFTDANTLSSICSLPASTGESIKYFAGFAPTSPTSAPDTPAPAPSTPTSAQPTETVAATSDPETTTAGTSPPSTTSSPSASPSDRGSSSASPSTAAKPSPTGSNTSLTSSSSGTSSRTVDNNSSSTSGADNNSSGTSAPSTAATAASRPSSTSKSGGLSTGVKAGIAVAAVISGLILLAVLATLLVRRRRRRRRSATPAAKEKDSIDSSRLPEPDASEPAEVEGRAARPWSMRSELEGSWVPPHLAEKVLEHGGAGTTNGSGRAGVDEHSGAVAELPGPVAELPGSEKF